MAAGMLPQPTPGEQQRVLGPEVADPPRPIGQHAEVLPGCES